MSGLPTDAFAAAEFLMRQMYRPVDIAAGQRHFAVAETEKPFEGDVWYWNDDNAKVLEFLSRPDLWQRFPLETVAIYRFVAALCRGPFIFRRIGAPLLERLEPQGAVERHRHSLLNLKCELSRGRIVAGQRYHDSRTFDNVTFGGNRVEFTYRGRRFRLPVDSAVEQTAAELNRGILILRHAGDLFFRPALRRVRLGRIGYTYTIHAHSMLIEVEAALDLDPNIAVRDVVLTIGQVRLSNYLYSVVAVHPQPAAGPLFTAKRQERHIIEVAGASYYQIRHKQIPGESLALHSLPRNPTCLAALEVVGEKSGLLNTVLAHYRFPGRQRGARLVAVEHKLLTAGGFYDRTSVYAEALRNAVATRSQLSVAWDFSTSYDYGATINAFAKCFAVTMAGYVSPQPQNLPEEARSLFVSYLRAYLELFIEDWRREPLTLASRDLAFVILGVVTMYRALGAEEYLRALRVLCDTLLEFELQFDLVGERASGFPLCPAKPPRASIDGHSAALLALTQAVPLLDDTRLAAAIDRGLAGYCLETTAVELGEPRRIDTVSAMIIDGDGQRRTHNSYWNFTAGLTLRFFRALRQSRDPKLQAIAARHAYRLELFEMVLRRQLAKSVTRHGDMIEIRCSLDSAETNSETQPWVMLGLLGHPCE